MLVACSFRNTLAWCLLILQSLAHQGEPQQNTDIVLSPWCRVRPKVPPAHIAQPQTWNQRRMQGRKMRERRSGEGAGSFPEEEEEEEKGNEGKKNKQGRRTTQGFWNSRLSGGTSTVADTWNLWHSTWESRAAALPEMIGFLNCRLGYFWVFLEPCQCRGRD